MSNDCRFPVFSGDFVLRSDTGSRVALYYRCGKCAACRRAKVNEWVLRLTHELSDWQYAYFLTLTFDDEHLPQTRSIDKRTPTLWLKRFRKILRSKCKYWLVGEYGGKFGRPHYHAILYTNENRDFIEGALAASWRFGFYKIGNVETAAIRYCCKYLFKQFSPDLQKRFYQEREPPFKLCSLGIGKEWAKRHYESLLKNECVRANGKELAIPRYYRKVLGLTVDDDKISEQQHRRQNYLVYKYLFEDTISDTAKTIDEAVEKIDFLHRYHFLNKYEILSRVAEKRQQHDFSKYLQLNHDKD